MAATLSRALPANAVSCVAATHPLWKAGFVAFVQFRHRPLQYMLPTRFETIPSSPIAHALAKTRSPSAAIASLNRMASAPLTTGSSSAPRSSIVEYRRHPRAVQAKARDGRQDVTRCQDLIPGWTIPIDWKRRERETIVRRRRRVQAHHKALGRDPPHDHIGMASDDEIGRARGDARHPFPEATERVVQFRRRRHAIGRTLSEACEIAPPKACSYDRSAIQSVGEVRSDTGDGRPPFELSGWCRPRPRTSQLGDSGPKRIASGRA